MNTFEIVKKAFILPFRAYKGFILVTALFFMTEMIKEIINSEYIGDLSLFIFIAYEIISIIILGVCIAISYHYVYDSFDIREVSLKTTAKAGFKDTMIESYYYLLVIIGTILISYGTGLYHNIFTLFSNLNYVEYKVETLTLPELIKYLSPDAYHHLAFSVVATLAIFVILFAICFSYCSFAKIRLTETGDIKESVNFIKITKIIKMKGVRKYLYFVILTFVLFATVFILMKTLESYFIIGSIISSMMEAFSLFFILDSFSLFYYS